MLKLKNAYVQESQSVAVIPISSIRPNPYQPRKTFSESALSELAASIKRYGLLQPINVRKTGDNSYELIAGERRLRASKLAGNKLIRAIITSGTVDQDSAMLALIENLQRENLHFFEEAEGYGNLIREHGLTQEELAQKLSKNQSTIANKLRILRLPFAIKELIIEGGLSERHARALLRLHNETAQRELCERIIKDGLSVKVTEELVEQKLSVLYGEMPDDKKIVRFRCNYSIYLNTLKKAVSKITESGVRTDFESDETDDMIEIKVRLYK